MKNETMIQMKLNSTNLERTHNLKLKKYSKNLKIVQLIIIRNRLITKPNKCISDKLLHKFIYKIESIMK